MPDLRIFLFWLELFVTLALCVSAKIRGSAGLLHSLFFCVSWLVVLNGVETGQRSQLAVLNGAKTSQKYCMTSCVEWGGNLSTSWLAVLNGVKTGQRYWLVVFNGVETSCVVFNVCYTSSHYTKQHMRKADITAEDWFRTLVWYGPPSVVVAGTQCWRMTHIYPSSLKDSELSRRRDWRNKNNHNDGHLLRHA